MKKIAMAAAAAVLAAALCACDAKDGKIDDGRDNGMFDNNSVVSRTTSRTTASRVMRDSDTHSGDGLLHDAASTVGEVGEDIADGADRMGSTVRSNVDDALDGSENENNDSNNMDNM